ncbi:MAG: cofactor-independent phosphoglycerate mutase [Candidatus Margulisbacteria bacterium]|nr:cofactor-independent phosphoglycerate mutase [Candidatus Margulisiibacteriota bacterium]
MKYVILIGDGMADEPLEELGGKTPLEVAKTPNMDFLAQNGFCGMARTIPPNMQPGSDVAAMSIFGFDPQTEYTGRGPLEAIAKDLRLLPTDLVYRCNLVTIEDDVMVDFTAGHIKTKDAHEFISFFNKKFGSDRKYFVPGVSYRHLLIIKEGNEAVETTPPHDITGQNITKYLPKGRGAKIPNDLIKMSQKLLKFNPLNGKRIDCNEKPVTHIWLWGQGKKPNLQKIQDSLGLDGAVITAVDLLKGLGRAAGMDIIDVPGATGFIDTNYEGKVELGLEALEDHELLIVHVEAPDECGHMGDIQKKIQAIEDFDAKIVGPYLKGLEGKEFRILVLPDHPTPIKIKTHTADPVPFVLYDSRKKLEKNAESYSESNFKKVNEKIVLGKILMKFLVKEELV